MSNYQKLVAMWIKASVEHEVMLLKYESQVDEKEPYGKYILIGSIPNRGRSIFMGWIR
jgi:hypothetical protein